MPADRLNQTTFAQLIAEGVLEIGDGYRAKNDELGGDGLIFLRAGHVTDTHIDFNHVDRFHAELEPRVRSKLAKSGDAVITTKGNSTGRTTFVSPLMPPFVYSPHLSYWRSLDPRRIEGGFLRYWCKGSEFRNQLGGMKSSTDMAPYLSLMDQKRLEITLPPVFEQRAIAHILGTLDDKIELNRRMIETLEAMARALFKSSFVDFDRTDAKGGRDGRVEEFLMLSRDTINPSSCPDERFDHYSIPAFDEGREPKTEMGGEIKSNKFLVPQNAVLLSKLNPRFPRIWLPSASDTSRPICSTEFLVAIPCEGVSREYLYGLFTSSDFFEVFASLVTGTSGSHQRVKPDYLLAMEVVIPPRETIRRYTEFAKLLHERIALNSKECRTLAGLRDTLLPKLISGELQVKNGAQIIAEGT